MTSLVSSKHECHSESTPLPFRWQRAVLVFCLIGVCWGMLFPALAKREGVQQRSRFLESEGLNPAAFFYSDVPAALEAQSRLQQLQQRQPDLFWSPRTSSGISEYD
ncbi:MAG: hypothetical protein KDA78_12625 [Planctomycetaceae bacterium]|nr:hypothetical protein [Planctomycetaceae bacterium]